MGHSSGEDINSIYTHVELPAKREAIRKLERWVKDQQQQLDTKGGANGTETVGPGNAQAANPKSGTEAVEEKDPGGHRA